MLIVIVHDEQQNIWLILFRNHDPVCVSHMQLL